MQAIRNQYTDIGIEALYKSGNYQNPHIDRINNLLYSFKRDIILENKSILDLCCGNGEVSKVFMNDNIVTGCDPYTHNFYKEQTNLNCFNYSFDDIAFKDNGLEYYDYIICSYALHLCDKSTMNLLLYKLSMNSKNLIILSPSDVILDRVNNIMNWKLKQQYKYERSFLFHFINS